MNLSPQGAQFVRLHEGFVGKWYADPVGFGTIGIGFTWASTSFKQWWAINKPGVKFGPGATITRAEAEAALIYLCDREYGKAVDLHYGKPVAQHVFDASTSVTFNCGPRTLGDRWAVTAKKGDYSTAAELLRSTRTTAKGKNLPGLVRRRHEEALLLEKGIYTDVSAMLADAMADGMLIRGERGPAVAELLRNLAFLGFYKGVQDDVFGYGAEEAVMAFQRAGFLTVDGHAGPKTLAAIAGLIGKPASPGTSIPKPSGPTSDQSPATPPEPQGFWAWLFSLFTKGN